MSDNMHCSFPQVTDVHDANMIDHMDHFLMSGHIHDDLYPNDETDNKKGGDNVVMSAHDANTTNSHSVQSVNELHVSHSVQLSTTPYCNINMNKINYNNNNSIVTSLASQPQLPH